MRTVTSPQLGVINAAHHNVYVRVQVEDSTGTFVELTTLYGVDWVTEVEWTEGNVDQSIMTGTVRLARSSLTPSTGLVSLAPDMRSSPANIVASVYAPLLATARGIKWQTATTAHGVAPVTADWLPMFWGKIDEIDAKSDDGAIVLSVRDLGGWLADTFIDDARNYSDSVGQPIESVMQSIINDNPQSKLGTVTLVTPVSPAVNVRAFSQDQKPLLEALRDLAGQIGWAIRYQWSPSGTYDLTLYEPARSQVTPDWTLGPDDYFDVPTYKQSDADVRTRGKLRYVDHVTGAPAFVTATASTSALAKFGDRFFEIDEDQASVIDTSTEAQAMLDAAISDLSDIALDGEIETEYFPVAEMGDLGGFLANAVHYDISQAFGVVQVRHALKRDSHRTFIQHRGKITGGYYAWLKKGGSGSTTPPGSVPVAFLQNFRIGQKTGLFVEYWWDDTPGATQVWVYDATALEPVNPVPWPPTADQVLAGAVAAVPTSRMPGGAGVYRVDYPKPGSVRFVQFEPRDNALSGGSVSRAVVYPPATPPTFGTIKQAIGATGSFANLTVNILDPQNLGGVLYAWVNRLDGDNNADPTALPDASFAIGSTPAVVLPTDTWSNGQPLLSGIQVHVGRGKQVYFEFVNSFGISSGRERVVIISEGAIVDKDGNLLPGTINNAANFVAGLQPVQVFTNVVDFPSSSPDGTFAFSTAIGKLFKRVGGIWDSTVAGADIVANSITAGQIAVGGITTSAIAAGAVIATKIGVSVLSGITSDLGIIVAGTLNSLSGMVTINLNATGTSAVFSGSHFSILADGTAIFSGDVYSTTFFATSAGFRGGLSVGSLQNFGGGFIHFIDDDGTGGGSPNFSVIGSVLPVDYTGAAGAGISISPRLYLNQLIFAGLATSIGAADSGGTGYRCLRVPN